MDLLHRESGLFNFFPMMRISASSKILVIILFFGCSLLNARYNERQFLHLTKPLSQNTGQCILQDHLGFLWIGTANGLNRFDGINVHSYEYDPKDTTSLSNNNIRKIAEDQTGDLWIATEFGLNRYSRDKDKFTRYYFIPGDANSISNNLISDVLVDTEGNIWIAAGDLCLFRPEANDFIRIPALSPNANNDRDPYHNFIYQDNAGLIWFGYWKDLFLLNKQRMQLELILDGNKYFSSHKTWHLHEMLQDKDGSYFLATNQAGLLRFEYRKNRPVKPERFKDEIGNNQRFSDFRILAIFIDCNNYLWISCENLGLVLLNPAREIIKRFYNKPGDSHSLGGNSVWSVFEDRDQRLWFGIWNAGVDYIDPYTVRFDQYQSAQGTNSISNNIVNDFVEDEAGNLWIATDGGGLNYFDRQKNTFTSYKHNPRNPNSLGSDAVLSICFDNADRLWAGTWNGGITILSKDKETYTHLNTTNSGLTSNDVFDVLYDGEDKMYIATYRGGLNIFNLKTGNWETFTPNLEDKNSISSNSVFMLFKDRQNSIWVGTLSDGLELFHRDKNGLGYFTHYQFNALDSTSISDNKIHSTYQDSKGQIWIGTSNGLNLMNRETGTFSVLGKAQDLPTNYISGITGDETGSLWLSSLKGITRIDASLKKIQHYGVTDNLNGNQFNRNAVYKTSAGEILFGGTNGFNIFNPENIKTNPHAPAVVLMDFKISNESVAINENSVLKKHISVTEDLVLSYKHSVFSFEFVALNFTHPEKNQYAYMMEGFENKWNYSGTRRMATYTNLNPGDYTFRVKAANNDGIWNDTGISLNITITPPFWRTWLAYLLYALFVISIFYAIMRYNLSKERLRHDLELEHLKLEKLSELDKIKSRFFTNVSHEIRTPIMLILGPLENMLKKEPISKNIKSKIQLIVRNAKRLSRLLNQLIDFYRSEAPDMDLNLSKNDIVSFVNNIYLSFKEYAKSRQIDFRFTSNLKFGNTWFDPDKLDKIIYNLLSNAFKFTPDKGSVSLSLCYHSVGKELNNYIEIVVKDNGIGIPEPQLEKIFERFYQVDSEDTEHPAGFGIGLHLTHEMVELHQGRISVNSAEGKGTTFIIQLPVDTIEFEVEGSHLENIEADQLQAVTINDPKSHVDGTPPLILFVEDEHDVQSYLKDIFVDKFKVISAYNGDDGYKKAMEFIPDLIISDIIMPKMDGYQLCEKLKSDEQTSHIPVILLTVKSEAEQKLKGIKLGADDYLPKPFNSEELLVRVYNLLETRRKLRASFKKQILLEPKDISVLSLDEKFLLHVKQEVEKYISDWRLDADRLAKEVGISRIQLYRKLKGLTGQTVHEFIRTVRLKRATQLLEQGKMRVTEIAYHVGFNDLNYFSRCFRKQSGKSPSEYIASQSQN
jgi:signal transduction histidine kinase/ligand-binding sensor domain-containing protein/DNA-binding response OmpR family regulator